MNRAVPPALALLAMVPFATLAAQQPVFDRECRRAVVKLCGLNRGAVRACLAERGEELPERCKAQLADAVRERLGEPREAAGRAAAPETLSVGDDPRQAVDLYPASGADRPPLVLFIHGGGWAIGSRDRVQRKPAFFNGLGYAFGSAGYRLVPAVRVEDQLADLGAAIGALRREAGRHGYDPDRIVLIGHSAGAHLAAMLATEPRWTGDDFAAIRGVVLLDGAAYDVPAQMAEANLPLRRLYDQAFGDDPERQRRLSPVAHAGAPDAPRWLILPIVQRPDSIDQSERLAAALRSAGAEVTVSPIAGTDHGRLNRELGDPAKPQTGAVAAFLAGLFPSVPPAR